jgi:HD superfamily phosphodiesterase
MGKGKVSGIDIPDSALAREITRFVRDSESELLFRHSTRVYFWGALSGRRRGLQFDPELLYAAAMFHDMGLTPLFRTSHLRFEVDGANAARAFLESHGIPQQDLDRVWLAIALHTTPGIPEHLHPEIALVHSAAGMDVVGRGFSEFSQEEREAVLAAYPRASGFKRGMIDSFYEGLKHRPETSFGTFNDDILACKDPAFRRSDLCRLILGSPWPD